MYARAREAEWASGEKIAAAREAAFYFAPQPSATPQETALGYDGWVPGRSYVQSDPLGLFGGLASTYFYANGQPTRLADAKGLWSTDAHDMIIEATFPGATSEVLAAIKRGSEAADSMMLGYQGVDLSFMHAMSSSSLSPEESCKKLNQFFKNHLDLYHANLRSANYWIGRGNQALANNAMRDAYFALGFAIHPIMDNTSPAHRGFQKWSNSDAHRHGVFPTSIEGTKSLTPALLKQTVGAILKSMSSGLGVDCSCVR